MEAEVHHHERVQHVDEPGRPVVVAAQIVELKHRIVGPSAVVHVVERVDERDAVGRHEHEIAQRERLHRVPDVPEPTVGLDEVPCLLDLGPGSEPSNLGFAARTTLINVMTFCI